MPKHPLQTAIENTGRHTQSYSGRGMYGATCLGVELSAGEFGELIGNVIEQLDSEDPDEVRSVADGFRALCYDNMGRDMIYYFPGVPHTDEDEESEGQAHQPECEDGA